MPVNCLQTLLTPSATERLVPCSLYRQQNHRQLRGGGCPVANSSHSDRVASHSKASTSQPLTQASSTQNTGPSSHLQSHHTAQTGHSSQPSSVSEAEASSSWHSGTVYSQNVQTGAQPILVLAADGSQRPTVTNREPLPKRSQRRLQRSSASAPTSTTVKAAVLQGLTSQRPYTLRTGKDEPNDLRAKAGLLWGLGILALAYVHHSTTGYACCLHAETIIHPVVYRQGIASACSLHVYA
jgi:hypothetical protein